MGDPSKVQWLFLDFDAYFASIEQQERSALRGRPVAVVPMMTDSTCCIAVSYEAKAFGVKTGTRVREAKRLCPGIALVEARHALYVRYHHAILEALDTCIPLDSVLSIDEMVARLTGSQQEIPNALLLAQKIKTTLSQRVGRCLRCSIGLAPNRFLAKVASEMQKPNGLTVIRSFDLPHILHPLAPIDLPGIGSRMELRLQKAGIHTVEQLCQLCARQMAQVWGGVVGERFWAWLHGEDRDEPPTQRRSVSHSHVLEPDLRNGYGAFRVLKNLTGKAAARLRRIGYWASGLSISIQFVEGREWTAKAKFAETQDTPTFFKVLEHLWENIPAGGEARPGTTSYQPGQAPYEVDGARQGRPAGKPLWVGVVLCPLVPTFLHEPSLFENPKREKLSHVMDRINEKYGRGAAYFASLYDAREEAPTRIAFTNVPNLSEVED